MLNAKVKQFRHQPCLPLVLVLVAGSAFSQDTSQPYFSIEHPRVLLMTGDSAGEASVARQALSYALTSVNFPVTMIDDAKLIDKDNLSQFDVFIQFGPARITADQEQALADFVNRGGGFLALQDAIDGPRDGAYERLIGGSMVRHAGPYRIYIHLTDAGRKSPITAGVRDFEILEEQVLPAYAVDTPAVPGQPRQAHVLMTGFAMDNTSDPERLKLRTNQITNPASGWWQEIGRGRMCYFSFGNTVAVMNHPMMQKLYENALRWLAREN